MEDVKQEELLKEGEEIQEETSEEEPSYEDLFEEMYGSSEAADPDLNAQEDDDGEESADDDAPDSDDAGSDPQEEGRQEQAAKAQPKPTEDEDPYAWIDSLPEEVRDKAVHLREQTKTHYGRATAFQRRASQLEEELRRAQALRDAEPADRSSKNSEPAAPKTLEKLERLKEDFPEFADALEEVVQTERQRVQEELRNQLKPLIHEQQERRSNQFVAAVDAEAERIFNTPETGVYWKDVVDGEDFRTWLEMQPRSVQQAASTPSAQEAVHVLRLFETDYQAALAEYNARNAQPETVSQETARAEQLKEKRQRRKEASAAPGSKPAGSSRQGGGDYEEMFDAMWG